VVKKDLLHSINKSSQGLARLTQKRIDIFVDDLNSTTPLIENQKLKLKNKVHVAGIMQTTPLYMYVHKKHMAKLPLLAGAIRDIKSEGLIKKYGSKQFSVN